jgi:hypothetical protein
MVVHACNAGTWKAEAGGWGVQDQPRLHSETWLKKKKCMRVHLKFTIKKLFKELG